MLNVDYALARCLHTAEFDKLRSHFWELMFNHQSFRCSSCGKDSAASSKMEDFYELELNIKGLNTLEESLNDYFSEEALDGENQYFCESCQKRVDATRCIKLRSLPPVVNFQLKRYVFLPKVIYLDAKLIQSFVVICSFHIYLLMHSSPFPL